MTGARFPNRFPIDLPIGSLMTFAPMTAAFILVHREAGHGSVRTLLMRVLDARKIRGIGWWLVALLIAIREHVR